MYHAAGMKKTLHIYIFREIMVPFLLGMATFTSVLLMGRFLKIADLVVAKGVAFDDVIRMIIYLLPYFCLVTIPMAFLLAILLAFGRLSADSEVTAIKASGVSLYGMLPPVLVFAFFAYLATAMVAGYALPWGNSSFKRLVATTLQAGATLDLKERVFIDDFPGLVIYTDRYDEQSRSMSGILIQDERDQREPITVFAAKGNISSDTGRRLVRLELHNGSIHRKSGKSSYQTARFQEYILTIDLGKSVKEITRDEVDMDFTELRSRISAHNSDTKLQRDMEMEYQRRFALPFACFVFALVGVPLGIQNQRSGKAAGFSLGIGVILVYYVVLSLGKALGDRGVVTAAVAVWTPNIAFLLMGGYLFRTTAAERRLYIFDLLSRIVEKFRVWQAGRGGR
jgi:lipopolysaccharide export system permease protein